MSEQIKTTASCPNCGSRIVYDADAGEVQCGFCDSILSVAALKEGGQAESEKQVAALGAIDSADAGLAYIETFFIGYDWTDFEHSPVVRIAMLTDMVEKQKIKSANNPATWILEFKSIAVPLEKKAEGLADLEKEIEADLISGEVDSYEAFDAYKRVVFALGKTKDSLFDTLDKDILFAEKYGAPAGAVAEMKETLAALRKKLDAVCKEILKPTDIPGVAAWEREQEKKVEDALRVKGIDAAALYKTGVSVMKSDPQKAMECFEKIKEYKDSAVLIAKLSRVFVMADFYEVAGKRYQVKRDTILFPVNEKQGCFSSLFGKKDDATSEEEDSVTGNSFYEIRDGMLEKEPAFTGVTTVLGVYGARIFYIKKRKSICCFDTLSSTEVTVDAAKTDDYIQLFDNKGHVLSLDHGSKLLFKKKLNLALGKKGCFAAILRLFKKESVVNYDNNFALVALDMQSGAIRTIVDEMIDTEFLTVDKIFFKSSRMSEDGKKKDILFRVVDPATGETKEILDEHADIHAVSADKVVYSRWTPNNFNMNLHVFDFRTEKDVLIEENIFNYMTLIGNRVYYTVGNNTFKPLFAVNLDGTERKEIMQNVETVRFVRGNWLYIVKGTADNKTLVKLSADGETRFCVCSQLKKIVKFTSSQIYYLDIFNALHVVRNDGAENKILVKSLPEAPRGSESVIIDVDYIYYLRAEYVGLLSEGANDEGEILYKGQYGYSLYRMDLDGHNVRKLIFNVDTVKSFDEDLIYFLKKENRSYRITTPVSKKENEITVRNYPITSYLTLNKHTGAIGEILVLGLPKAKTASIKAGCFGKMIDKDVIFEEIPTTIEYEKLGGVDAGAIHEQKEAESLLASLKAKLKKK